MASSLHSLSHPWDPLSGEEISRAVDVVKKAYGKLFYQAVTLLEPRKADMSRWLQDTANIPRPPRIADVTVIGPEGKVYDAFVDMATTRILKWEELDEVQPIVRAHRSQKDIGVCDESSSQKSAMSLTVHVSIPCRSH